MVDETIVRRVEYRVVRPDGNLIWTAPTTNVAGWVPRARRDGWFAPPGCYEPSAPPFLIQRLDGDTWVTIDQGDDAGAVFLPGSGTTTWSE